MKRFVNCCYGIFQQLYLYTFVEEEFGQFKTVLVSLFSF
ncbi:hypothetical protein LEP1GSC201_3812 [Leptospira interrogans serovar Pomona str. Fox 32256]|nr:hypothetical protein LEP1GSC201_3812 [Leptospira interrogans serovar Pomona str. Fox 32256]